MTSLQILKKFWGYDAFRPLQEDIVQSVLDKKDTLALLPTGGGKSICFQVPALMLDGICLVVSPLIALMKDQVEQLRNRKILAQAIYSGMNRQEIDNILDNCAYGDVKFLYLSPERLKTPLFQERLKKMKVNLLAIDEAHCISQWGYDFRPPYLEIAQLREQIPDVPCIALTATATPEVQKDIKIRLNFAPDNQHFQKSFARDNLSYSCFEELNKSKRMLKILRNVKGSGIVYVRSRRQCQLVSDFLNQNQIRASYYHAGLTQKERDFRQEAWINNKSRVIVATNAFGMGIDKPDVRVVIHLDAPDTPEAYYQEAGRAGRDEKRAFAVVLYDKKSLEMMEKRTRQSHPDVLVIKQVYQALANYYKIAVGSSLMASYDFKIEEFHQTYKINYLDVFYSIKRLEEQGLIQLNKSFYHPSKVWMCASKIDLYKFQLANPKLDKLIKMLLRMYGGELFNKFIQINEEKIAKNLSVYPESVRKQLKFLLQHEILEYSEQKEIPQLTFITARQDAINLKLDLKLLESRRKGAIEKVQAIQNYLTNPRRCRTLLLLEYFGEISDKNCGVCDFCLEEKRKFKTVDTNSVEEKIIALVEEGKVIQVESLVDKLSLNGENTVLECLQSLIANEILAYDKFGRVILPE
jgi:ATP-dependent DNA helicase RecQ